MIKYVLPTVPLESGAGTGQFRVRDSVFARCKIIALLPMRPSRTEVNEFEVLVIILSKKYR